MPTSAARRRVSLENARDVGGGGLSEDIPDNRENGRRGLPGQFSDDENAVMRRANHAGLLVQVRQGTACPPPGLMGDAVFRGPDSLERMHKTGHCARPMAPESSKAPISRRARFHRTRAVSMLIPRKAAISVRVCPWISFNRNTSRWALGSSSALRIVHWNTPGRCNPEACLLARSEYA